MAAAGKIRIAVAQTEVTTDPRANGTAIRAAMRQAADRGARLVHFSEGALSGYVGPAKAYYTGWRIDGAPVDVALNRARPWRETARDGRIYTARRISDPRSTDRTRA